MGNKRNDLANWKTGKYPGIDAYLKALADPKSATHQAVDDAKVQRATPTSIWEVGVATGINAQGVIIGNTALSGPGPNGSMIPLDIDNAFAAMGIPRDFNQRVFFHDHSEYGSVLTNQDIESARALHSVVIARRDTDIMIYIPDPKGP